MGTLCAFRLDCGSDRCKHDRPDDNRNDDADDRGDEADDVGGSERFVLLLRGARKIDDREDRERDRQNAKDQANDEEQI